jgi:hypothetical protein
VSDIYACEDMTQDMGKTNRGFQCAWWRRSEEAGGGNGEALDTHTYEDMTQDIGKTNRGFQCAWWRRSEEAGGGKGEASDAHACEDICTPEDVTIIAMYQFNAFTFKVLSYAKVARKRRFHFVDKNWTYKPERQAPKVSGATSLAK